MLYGWCHLWVSRKRALSRRRKNDDTIHPFDSPLFLGFDHFERTFDRIKKNAAEGYPPYNIEQIGDSGLRITLAVAGFSMDELSVEVDQTSSPSVDRKRTKRMAASISTAGSQHVSLCAALSWRTVLRSWAPV
jgi:HSP20 family molecular chaperone IbpA